MIQRHPVAGLATFAFGRVAECKSTSMVRRAIVFGLIEFMAGRLAVKEAIML